MTAALTAAREWIDRGCSVLPVGWRSKRPAFDALRRTNGGTWEPYKSRTATDDELAVWFGGARQNLAVVTGYDGLVVIDFDAHDAYMTWLSWAAMQAPTIAGMLASTFRVFTARGVHVYLRVAEPVESYRVGQVDVKARWGYTLVPPSRHPSGHDYQATDGAVLGVETLAEVFPLKPDSTAVINSPVAERDPWAAADHAVADVGGVGVVAAIKARISTASLLGLQDTGRRQMVICPLHADHNPSLTIYPDGSWHCFGCGRRGDVVDLHAALHGLTNRESLAQMATMIGERGGPQ